MPSYCLDLTIANTPGRYRGIGRYALSLADALLNLESELFPDECLKAIVCHEGKPRLVELCAYRDFVAPVAPPLDGRAARRWYRRDHGQMIRKLIPRNGVDLFHAVEGVLSPTSWLRPMGAGWPSVVVTCHDLIPLEITDGYLVEAHKEIMRRLRDYIAYHRADAVIAVSQATLRSLERILDLGSPKAEVIYNGVNLETHGPIGTEGEEEVLRRKYGLPPRYTLYLGDHDPRKRVPLLLAAQNAVYRATGVPLVLAGTCRRVDELDRDARQVARRLPEGALNLVGRVDAEDLPALYRAAELHVLPSVLEGFGLTVLEAMACGCPVITTRAGSLAEVGGDAVLYISEDDVTSIEQAMVQVLNDPGVRARLGVEGPPRAGIFPWDRCARETLKIYRRVMHHRVMS